jgi:cytidylate kinase
MIGSIDRFVNQQILKWQEERRIAEKKAPHNTSEVQKPVVCISRQFAARGAEMGQMVAERLGYRFYSQELIHFVAEEAHVRQQVVESLDERGRDGVAQWVTGMIQRRAFAPSDYLRNLSKVVLTLGRHGKGVIMGRGAHFILDASLTLRVRVIAPLPLRLERVMEKYHLGEEAARAKLLRIDGEREAFNRQHYQADITDPQHYDLMVNTAHLPLEACADTVASLFRARFSDA